MIVAIDHVQLAMPPGGEAQARAFYGDVLGLSEVAKPALLAARGGCWFERGAVRVHLGVEPGFRPARKAHPAFLTTDLEQCRRDLEAAGVATTPDDSVVGVRRCYAADPFGNRIEFIQDGDGFSQREEPRTENQEPAAVLGSHGPSLDRSDQK